MRRSPLKFLLVFILVAGIFVFINKNIGNKISLGFVPHYGQGSAGYIFTRLSVFKKTLSSMGTVSALVRKNMDLERNNLDLLSRLAETETLRNENEFLRKALKLSDKIKRDILIGNVYGWGSTPGGYSVLLNKGKADGISPGNIIISEEKVLIGTVEKTENGFSRILAVSDPGFRITAKVLGSETAGIASGALNDGLSFDLIVQDDEIKEGDTIVSSGNDTFPDSLIIGKVGKIELTENQLFKKVLIEPAMRTIILGPVIILK